MNIDSIQMRLKAYSKSHKRIHQFTITRYFQERFLYRLSKSGYKKNFLLKGGALVYYFSNQTSRYTRDIDLLLISLDSEVSNLLNIFREISEINSSDGVVFASKHIGIMKIEKEGLYDGIRVKIPGSLGNIRHQIQIDIGVGDYVTPGPQEIEYPTLLKDLARPILQAYSIETVISEKFEAMISLGEYNSRMKDFYDVYNLLSICRIEVLGLAIKNTFERRSTPVIADHPLFREAFYIDQDRVKQWNIFLANNELEKLVFERIGERIKVYLYPIYAKMKS